MLKPTTQHRNLHCSVFCGLQSERKGALFFFFREGGRDEIEFFFFIFIYFSQCPIILSSKLKVKNKNKIILSPFHFSVFALSV